METGNVLIGAISIMLIVIPFVLMYRKSKKTERGLVGNLKKYAEINGLKLDEWESVENLILGIDYSHKVAFFAQIEASEYEMRYILLDEMSSCSVNRDVREVAYHGGKDRVIHRVAIGFQPKNKMENEEVFLLFDEDQNKRLNGEIQLSEAWGNKYNDSINSLNSTTNKVHDHSVIVR